MHFQLALGDVLRLGADALITTLRSDGMWFRGVHRLIKDGVGDRFHDQALQAMPLRDGQTIIAHGGPDNTAAFSNVIFVVDDLKQPLRNLINAGLTAANDAGFQAVSLTPMRLGVVEKTKDETLHETIEGVVRFTFCNPFANLVHITFVVDQRDAELFVAFLQAMISFGRA